jgi:hypothetical protein
MNTRNLDLKPDHGGGDGRDHANDNQRGEKAIVPAPAGGGGALTSLAALGAALNSVDTASVVGRSGKPMLSFKRDGNGTWAFGQRRTVVEDGSRWAVNPTTFKWGYVAFNDNNKPTERLVPVSQSKPEVAALPNVGFDWQEQWTVDLKCIDGADAGVEVTYKASTDGGLKAIGGLIEEVRDRLNGSQHDGQVSPIVLLKKDSYQHSQYGRVWTPVLEIVAWMPMSGPEPAPASPPPVEQSRRRRVA